MVTVIDSLTTVRYWSGTQFLILADTRGDFNPNLLGGGSNLTPYREIGQNRQENGNFDGPDPQKMPSHKN